MKTYNCPKKHKARLQTIVLPYLQHFGKRLPRDHQYWTLCATCADTKGELLEGSELQQVLEADLIQPDQFHGVDYNEEIIQTNQDAIPEAHWHHGDFYKTMVGVSNSDFFNPGIVNYDSLRMAKHGALYFARIMSMLSVYKNVLLVGNFILKVRSHRNSVNEVLKELMACPQFRHAFATGWWHEPWMYVYPGTGRRCNTEMGSVVFWR
jgi:hypothetical protein